MSERRHEQKVKDVGVDNDCLCIELLSGLRLMGPLRTNPVGCPASGSFYRPVDEARPFDAIDQEHSPSLQNANAGGQPGLVGQFVKRRLRHGSNPDFAERAVRQGDGRQTDLVSLRDRVLDQVALALQPADNVGATALGDLQLPADVRVS